MSWRSTFVAVWRFSFPMALSTAPTAISLKVSALCATILLHSDVFAASGTATACGGKSKSHGTSVLASLLSIKLLEARLVEPSSAASQSLDPNRLGLP